MKTMVVCAINIVLVTVSIGNAKPPSDVQWTWGPVLPIAQSALGTVVVDKNIVLVGGTYWVGPRDGVPTKHWSNKVQLLNTETMKWESLPDYPLSLGYPLVVADGRKVWVIAKGRTPDSKIRTYFSNRCLLYNIATDEYRPLVSSLRMGVADHGTAYVDGKVYVIGGEDSLLRFSRKIQARSVSEWIPLPPFCPRKSTRLRFVLVLAQLQRA